MENFVVSARKYRPTTFDTVVGQEHVTRTLINEIKNNQLAQAFLFNGPRGVGKTTCARILAKEINKESVEDESYDFSYNIFELDAASNNSVEDIRLLNEQVRIPPQVGKYKVYIIDEVHMLSAAAFNAFLKTLEEPPAYAIFILATTERHKILPTILSRCQVFNFNRITVPDIVKHLKSIGESENIELEEEALHIIAQKADGALRDALSIFDQMVSISADRHVRYQDVVKNLNVLDYDYYFKVTDAFLQQDIGQVMLIFDDILDHGFDGQLFLNGLANHLRDLMVCRSPETVRLLDVPPHVHQKYLDTAKSMSQGFLVNSIQIINSFDQGYKASKNQRLHVELALIKICYLPSLISGEKKKPEQELKPKKTAPSEPSVPQSDIQPIEESVASESQENVAKKEEVEGIEAPKVKEAAPAPKLSKKATSDKVVKLGNLEDLLNDDIEEGNSPDSVVQEDSIAVKSEGDVPVESITQEQLETVVKDFADKLKTEGRNIQQSLFAFIKPIWENGTVKVELIKQHKIQLEEFKVEFLQYLRSSLNYGSLSLNVVEVKRKAEGSRAYTAQEKFEVMAKKNPSLNALKEKLKLDFK